MGKRLNTAVWFENQKRWQVKVQKDGTRKTFTSSKIGRAGKREANAKADAWLDDGIVSGNTKVALLMDQWLADLRITTSKSNCLPNENYAKNWIKPVIGAIKIENLNEGQVQNVINNAYSNGKLAEKTLKNLRACLSSFIKYARKHKTTNLTLEDIKIPTGAKKSSKTTLQPDDLKILFHQTYYSENKPEWYIHAFRFQVLTGLRPGELCGLMNSDFKGLTLFINRSINRYNEFTSGKNKNAIRAYKLPKTAIKILDDQKEMLKSAAVISPFTFPDRCGEFTKQASYGKHWKKYRIFNNLTNTTPYELRHTFVSVNKQAPKALLDSVIGHSADMDTFGVYGHEMVGDSDMIANLIDDNFKKYIR